MSEPTLNIPLLRKVQAHILEEPKRVWMDYWVLTEERAKSYATTARQYNWDTDIDALEHLAIPTCGTVGCISGWAGLLTEANPMQYDSGDYGVIALFGRLVYSVERPYSTLFLVDEWPFLSRIDLENEDQGTPEYARVVSRRIDEFIAEWKAAGRPCVEEDSHER